MKRLVVWLLILGQLAPSGALAISETDRNAVLYDTVFFDQNDYSGSVVGEGGCVSPLLPPITNPSALAAAINQYVTKLSPKSPMRDLGRSFVEAGIKYGINPMWVVNIARKESSFGINVPKGSNNPYGLTATSSQPHVDAAGRHWYKFDSFEASIDHETRYLKESYINQHLTTFEAITAKYAPPSENDTATYVNQMKQWVGDVVQLAGDALDCGTANQELPQ